MPEPGRRRLLLSLLGVAFAPAAAGLHAQAAATVPGPATLMTREQAAQVMPATVFYRGQTAPIQARNAAGLELAGKRYVLVALVDTSGYSSSVQEAYQAYLLTEVKLNFGSATLPPGAYGVGFVAGDKFLVTDLGGHPVLTAASVHDAVMPRPNPMQMLKDPQQPDGPDGRSEGRYRLYSGRNYVELSASAATP